MGITAVSGPRVTFGVTAGASGVAMEYNDQRGPSISDLGEALLDPRPQFTYQPGAVTNLFGWATPFGPVVDQIPSAISTNAVALSFSATGTAPFSVSPAISTAGGQLTAVPNFLGSTLTAAITVYAIDTPMAGIAFGLAGTINLWDPAKAVSRCLTVSGTSGSSNTNYVFKGFDLYGYQMTATVQGTSAGAGNTVTTLKAFKYLQSITANTTTTGGSSNVTIGIADVYGFPLRVDTPGYATVWWGNSTATTPTATLVNAVSSVSHAFASTATATATTGDIRGTINPSTYAPGASNGTTNRLTIFIGQSVKNLQSMTLSSLAQSSLGNQYAGLLGVPQF